MMTREEALRTIALLKQWKKEDPNFGKVADHRKFLPPGVTLDWRFPKDYPSVQLAIWCAANLVPGEYLVEVRKEGASWNIFTNETLVAQWPEPGLLTTAESLEAMKFNRPPEEPARKPLIEDVVAPRNLLLGEGDHEPT